MELRERLNRIRDFVQILQEHQSVLYPAELSENLIKWRQHGHLIREPRRPERLQPRFLLDDGLLDSRRRLLPEGELGTHRRHQV